MSLLKQKQFQATKVFKSVMEIRKVNDKRLNLMSHALVTTDNHHFRLNITADKTTSLDLTKMGL